MGEREKDRERRKEEERERKVGGGGERGRLPGTNKNAQRTEKLPVHSSGPVKM